MATYTYDDTLPTEMDDARSQLQAIPATEGDAATGLISNEHIIAVIAAQGSLSAAVAYMARELALRFARKIGRVTLPSGLSVAWPDRVKYWWELAGIVDLAGDGSASPASGLLTTTAPVAPPTLYEPDANDRLYRGDPYRRRFRP